ncbi:hypothetical protein AURDEDRAFT_157895 [Auricularia subglabra TFB-10046 SS5]|nr:hypothetical protein AURDEDRAFT_157895 [Auricularia subglabra TFB-10046 SS5]
MESGIAELCDVLHDQSRADHVGQYDVYRILESNRARPLAVSDVGAHNGAAHLDVESGKIEYNGQRLLLNAEFQRAAVALYEQLNVSEVYCARLLKDVEASHPNAALNASIERAILQFHNIRYQTARCLLQLFAVPAYEQFRDTLIMTMVDLPGSKRGRLADKVILEIDNVTSTMAAVANALANATTAASSPYGLAHGTLSLRLKTLHEERHILGHVLYAIAANRNLTGVEVMRLVEWLPAHALQDDMVPYVFMAALFALDLGEDDTSLCDGKTFIGHATRLFDTTTDWKAPQMHAALTLQWALFLYDVLGDGFLCLSAFIDDEQLVAQPEMRRDLLVLLERLVSAVVMHMTPVLRRIKHKQEDVAASEQCRQDIAALFRTGVVDGMPFWFSSSTSCTCCWATCKVHLASVDLAVKVAEKEACVVIMHGMNSVNVVAALGDKFLVVDVERSPHVPQAMFSRLKRPNQKLRRVSAARAHSAAS